MNASFTWLPGAIELREKHSATLADSLLLRKKAEAVAGAWNQKLWHTGQEPLNPCPVAVEAVKEALNE